MSEDEKNTEQSNRFSGWSQGAQTAIGISVVVLMCAGFFGAGWLTKSLTSGSDTGGIGE